MILFRIYNYLLGYRIKGGGEVEDYDVTPTEHLSPSTTSRLSDSDPSDLDDSRERRVADGASISSLGSSNRYTIYFFFLYV